MGEGRGGEAGGRRWERGGDGEGEEGEEGWNPSKPVIRGRQVGGRRGEGREAEWRRGMEPE